MKKHLNKVFLLIAIALIFIATAEDVLFPLDTFFTDRLYSNLDGTERNIIIVGIDDETLSKYGNFKNWSRGKIADLIEKLYEDEENAPSVVALDLNFNDYYNYEDDLRLAKACEGKDVIIGSIIVYRGAVEVSDEGERFFNKEHISDIEMPYEELNQTTQTGYSNQYISSDGYVRYAQNSVKVPKELSDKAGNELDSFAYRVYKTYQSKKGEEIHIPRTNRSGQFQFLYSGKAGEFSKVSLDAVLSDKVRPEAFKDAIVMVGAYAPGFQDSYQPASDRGKVMYGVEIHANVIQAYMQGKTMISPNNFLMAAIVCAIILLFIILFNKKNLFVTIPVSVGIALLYALAGRILSSKGIYISCIYVFASLALADLYFVIEKYFLELLENLRYQEEIKEQMWSFTEAMAAAIDERTPYNASHTRNVAKYSGMIADYINEVHAKGEEEEVFSIQRKEQLVMGALLHDIGKLAIPLEVMNKETRLNGKEKEIESRLDTFKLKMKIAKLENKIDEASFDEFAKKADDAVEIMNKVNGMGFVDDNTRTELNKVLDYVYTDADGNSEPFFTDEEKECLQIVKGTLTDEERKVMQSHVEITGRILDKVHFNKYFAESPKLAIKHHECLNGKGYPNGLTAEDLNTDARIIAVADIYDALVADDRPYKRPIPREKAFDIMRNMAKDGNIDAKLVEYLYECTKVKTE